MEWRKMWSVGGTERVDERLVCELTPNGGVPVPLWKVRRNLIREIGVLVLFILL
jgi:hypothetical protein